MSTNIRWPIIGISFILFTIVVVLLGSRFFIMQPDAVDSSVSGKKFSSEEKDDTSYSDGNSYNTNKSDLTMLPDVNSDAKKESVAFSKLPENEQETQIKKAYKKFTSEMRDKTGKDILGTSFSTISAVPSESNQDQSQ